MNCSDTKAIERKQEKWMSARFFKTEKQYDEMMRELQEWKKQGRPRESSDPVRFYCLGKVVKYF